jgi:hypothetical protein
MLLTHNKVVTGINNPAWPVSKDAWNAAHTATGNSGLPIQQNINTISSPSAGSATLGLSAAETPFILEGVTSSNGSVDIFLPHMAYKSFYYSVAGVNSAAVPLVFGCTAPTYGAAVLAISSYSPSSANIYSRYPGVSFTTGGAGSVTVAFSSAITSYADGFYASIMTTRNIAASVSTMSINIGGLVFRRVAGVSGTWTLITTDGVTQQFIDMGVPYTSSGRGPYRASVRAPAGGGLVCVLFEDLEANVTYSITLNSATHLVPPAGYFNYPSISLTSSGAVTLVFHNMFCICGG